MLVRFREFCHSDYSVFTKFLENRGHFLKIISIDDLCELTNNRQTIVTATDSNVMAEIFPSAQVDCNPPLNLSGNSDADLFVHSPIPHLYKSTHIAGRVSLAVLSDIRMLTPHGLLFDSGGNLIAESYHNSKMVQIVLREVQTMLSDGLVNTEPTKTIKTPAMLLMGPWSWVYHHWILENLPRLWAVDEFPELGKVPLVVPGDITEFQEASLKALGIGSIRSYPLTDQTGDLNAYLCLLSLLPAAIRTGRCSGCGTNCLKVWA